MCRASGSARIGVARKYTGLMLVVLATAGTAWAPAGPSTFQTAVAKDLEVSRPVQDTARRPFRHISHDDLPCRGCHGSGATHRVTLVRNARDCATCHHDPQRGLTCTNCHSSGSLGGDRRASLSIHLAVDSAPRTRDVAFQHDPHIAVNSGVTCRDCHSTDVTLARNRECSTCHTEHHTARAECTTCHTPPRDGAHDASVHLSCATGSCHSPERAPSPTLSRTLCVYCHAEQRDHEPGGSCAACHRIPGMASVPGGRHASWGLRSP